MNIINIKKFRKFSLFYLSLITTIAVWVMHFWGNQGYYGLVFSFILMFLLYPPKRAFSPASITYAYYGVWFVISPFFAIRYLGKLFLPEYSLSFSLVYTVFIVCINSIFIGTRIGYHSGEILFSKCFNLKDSHVFRMIVFLFFTSTLMIYLIIYKTGGFSDWINSPGDAFLNRGGSGVFVILSHFSSILLASIVGYYSYSQKNYFILITFLIWVFITSPVHGSKMQISLLVIMSLIPFLRSLKLFSLQTISLYFLLLLIFFLGLYFRNVSWITLETFIPYSLNYFSTLDNLAVSLRDMQPSLLSTFFLPFEKFKSPIGLSHPGLYFDMNHLLTDIYLPTAWKIRATEQWPVETDFYLNFLFFGGLPLIALYIGFVSFLHGYAIKYNNLGSWAVSFLMTIFIVSHLRGSLYNHIDFYMYPYLFFVWIFLYRLNFSDKTMIVLGKNDI